MSQCAFFFNDTATTEIYALSLHDALPIFGSRRLTFMTDDATCDAANSRNFTQMSPRRGALRGGEGPRRRSPRRDRKSTRLNSSHANISYAVFCLTKRTHSPSASDAIESAT